MANRLYSELLYVIGNKDLQRTISQAFNKKLLSLEQAKLFLLKKCYEVHLKLKSFALDFVIPEEIKSQQESEEFEFEKAYKAIFEFDKKYTKALFNINRISSQKFPQMFGRNKQLKGQFTNFTDLKKQIDELKSDAIRDAALDYYSGGKLKNFDTYIITVIRDLSDAIRAELKGLERRLHETSAESEQSLIKEVIELLTSFTN